MALGAHRKKNTNDKLHTHTHALAAARRNVANVCKSSVGRVHAHTSSCKPYGRAAQRVTVVHSRCAREEQTILSSAMANVASASGGPYASAPPPPPPPPSMTLTHRVHGRGVRVPSDDTPVAGWTAARARRARNVHPRGPCSRGRDVCACRSYGFVTAATTVVRIRVSPDSCGCTHLTHCDVHIPTTPHPRDPFRCGNAHTSQSSSWGFYNTTWLRTCVYSVVHCCRARRFCAKTAMSFFPSSKRKTSPVVTPHTHTPPETRLSCII